MTFDLSIIFDIPNLSICVALQATSTLLLLLTSSRPILFTQKYTIFIRLFVYVVNEFKLEKAFIINHHYADR